MNVVRAAFRPMIKGAFRAPRSVSQLSSQLFRSTGLLLSRSFTADVNFESPLRRAVDPHKLTAKDIWDVEKYNSLRSQLLKVRREIKAVRRIEIGPHASITFENYDLLWFQTQEMLWIEQGGEEQMKDELEAYNPLIPTGNKLVATLMFEIDNKPKRQQFLCSAGHIEHALAIEFNGRQVKGVPIYDDIDRTSAEGKTSAVHFIEFHFSDAEKETFKTAVTEGKEVLVGISHDKYPHKTILTKALLQELVQDIDA